ncbi:MAG: hypothetical protein AAF491_03990, partial [Verrucomicrobiota bacterium]
MIQKTRFPQGLSAALVFLTGSLSTLVVAQTAPLESYPDPTAAAGMTSGMSSGMTAQQIEMARVRTEAQTAQGEAVAASMARSVDQTMEAQSRQRTLQSAREIKAIKRSMAERLKWERANSTQVNKVSSDEMSAWNTSSGNVRVERDVPDPFLQALIEEERILMENGTLQKEKKGFNPLKSTGAALTSPLRMFSKDEEEISYASATSAATVAAPVEASQQGGGGFFSNLKMPKIGGRNEPVQYVDASTAEPQFSAAPVSSSTTAAPATVGSSSSAPTPSASTTPRISGAELVDGSSPTANSPGNAPGNPYVTETGTSMNASPAMASSAQPERGGFFSRFKSNDEPATPSSGSGGGFLGFGKKKSKSAGEPGIDSSLFPEGSFAQEPTGAGLSGDYSATDVAQDTQMAASSTGSFTLPGEEPEKKRFGFSMPKPNRSIPTIGAASGNTRSTVPTLTTINCAGNDFYVVTCAAQF